MAKQYNSILFIKISEHSVVYKNQANELAGITILNYNLKVVRMEHLMNLKNKRGKHESHSF